MPPVLRKRKAPAELAVAPPAKKRAPVAKPGKKATSAPAIARKASTQTLPPKPSTAIAPIASIAIVPKSYSPILPPKASKFNSTPSAGKVTAGSKINLNGFGGEIQTNDGQKTTLEALVDASYAGVVLFTYPKASTPGCTKQVCNFRDAYTDVTSKGFAVYGLSKDSPKANTTFKQKQKLPYQLLCDPSATLISAIGLKKEPSGTTRGVVVVNKLGRVLAAGPGSPESTLNTAKKALESLSHFNSRVQVIIPAYSDGTPLSKKLAKPVV